MTEIILWSLLAFFSAFGLVEFIRFAYADWICSEDDFHIIVRTDKFSENIEGAIRNAVIATDARSIILLVDNVTENDAAVLEKLLNKYSYIRIMKTEEYIDYLRK